MKYCQTCGAEMHDNAVMCVKCGCAVENKQPAANETNGQNQNISPKGGLVVLLLCIFLGSLGIHRFYVGKTGTGIAMLLTAGGCGIWTLIDLITIVMGNFTDAEGKVVKLQ